MRRFIYIVFLFVILSDRINAQNNVSKEDPMVNKIRIGFKDTTIAEVKAKEQLERLVKSYPIGKWIYTDTIVIEEFSIPHSHSVLTLNARYLDDDAAQLATFLHEQFHWLASMRKEQLDVTIARFEKEYPVMPVNLPLGARDRFNGYLHLVICDLEFQAMTQLVGESRAREVLRQWKHYTWIYDKVLNDEKVRLINEAHGFSIERF
jgi:hypothetical protein